MTIVYELWHTRRNAFGDDNEKRIGSYSTRANAEQALLRVSDQPGFRDYPNGFGIFETTLDRDHWEEGFISWMEALHPEGTPVAPALSGLRVIAVEQYGAGPYGSMQLADLGAEIIKIENPADGGDMARRVGPYFVGPSDSPDDSQFFHSFNRNKKSVTLDLKKPAAREILRRLAARADACFDNLRGDLPAKLGLTYADLAPANPKIVCAHLSAYGRDGSRAHWPGYDYLMQAETGYLSVTGEPDGPPARMGLSVVDLMTGLFAAFALVSGVLAARETGKGRDLDVCLFDTALQNLCYLSTWYLNSGHVQGREPRSAHPSLVPSQLYRTRDGFIFLMCNKEKFWPILCERIGHPEWGDDPRFRRFKDRLANRDLVNRLLDDALSLRTTAEWLEHFAGQVPAAPVNDLRQALDNPFVAERNRIGTYGPVRMVEGPIRDAAQAPHDPAPALGADTDAVLAECGFSAAEIAAFRAENII